MRAELGRDRSLGLIWGDPEGGAVPLMAVWLPRYLEEGKDRRQRPRREGSSSFSETGC